MIALLAAALGAEGTVTVPLAALEARLAGSARPAAAAPQVVTGAARWVGVADPETLALTLDATLRVALAGEGWKEVPLLGADAVLLGVEVDGAAVPVSRAGDHHTWPTDAVGEHTVRVRALVAPSGQRGAVEYDFGVPRTAATRLELSLPRPGLKPEVAGAVRADVATVGVGTRVVADLAPTDRIRLVGLRDLGGAEVRPAKQLAEAAHLVSVDERRIEVFSVFDWTVLYAGASRFDVFVPEGLEVVSADARGAFSWTLEPAPGGRVLRGETADPIRGRYEVSLRLARDLPDGPGTVALPHTVGAEREHGWVGVEAPGRVALDDVAGEDLVEADVRLLPEALRTASVSPLLRGFRSHGGGAVHLVATPLPEVEVDSERLDRVAARTVVSASGRAVTELSVTLRNRLRPGLALALPPDAAVGRALLDGEPVVPARRADGRVVVPLRRSAPDAPFAVTVSWTEDVGAPAWVGATALALPALDLPASEVTWEVALPAGWRWSALGSEVASQARVGSGHWLADAGGAGAPVSSAPPRVVAPEGAETAVYTRYWVPAGEPVAVRATHVAPALRTAGALGALAAAVAGALGLAWARVRRAPLTP